MTRPRLIVAEEHRRSGWNALSFEQRQGYRDRAGARIPLAQGEGMTTRELIAVMGPLHAHHPDFKERPRSLLPVPNLAGVQPCVSHCDHRMLGQIKWTLMQLGLA